MTLRPIQPADAVLLVPFFQESEMIRLLGLPGPRDEIFLKNLIQSALEDPGAVYDTIEYDGSVVGYAFLDHIDISHRHATETGVMVGPSELWDRKLGRAAFGTLLEFGFDVLHLHRASLAVLEENTRAIRSYEALGFRHEGRRSEALLLEEGWEDALLMGVIDRELNRIAVAEAVEAVMSFSRTQEI
jgi:RimJ/RimL family protein N-acetyltransferase